MLKKRIKLSLIPDVIEQLEIWAAEEGEDVSHIVQELREYEADSSGHKKPYLLLSPKESNLLSAAVVTRTYWDY